MLIIYGHQRCGWCIKAKKLAQQYNISFDWKDTDNPEILNDLKTKLPDVRTVPQIWWYTKHLGGYEDFVTELQNTIGGYGEQKF